MCFGKDLIAQAARYNNQTECIAILEKKWKELEYEARVNMMKLLELDTKSEERYYGPKQAILQDGYVDQEE